jgi:hypothetical protein
MNEIIAEREIFAISPKGEKKKLHIALGKPYQVIKDEWTCPVQIKGLYENLRGINGIDSWQALTLAMILIHQLLSYFLENGGKLYWKEGGEEISLKEIFPS